MRDDSAQDIYEQLKKVQAEARKKLKQAEIELKKAEDKYNAALKELALYKKDDEE